MDYDGAVLIWNIIFKTCKALATELLQLYCVVCFLNFIFPPSPLKQLLVCGYPSLHWHCWTGPQALWTPQCPISVRKKKGFIWPLSATERQEVSVMWLRRSSALRMYRYYTERRETVLFFNRSNQHFFPFTWLAYTYIWRGVNHPELKIDNSGWHLEKSKTFLLQEALHRVK